MSQSVKVKVRPGGTLAFPAVCVHCSRPASERMFLKKRRGRLTRLIDVPLCVQCAAALHRQSGQEERLGRLGRFLAALAAILVLFLGLLLLPAGMPFLLRLLIAVTLSALAGLLLLAYFRRRSLAAASSDKLEILDSARLAHFSWRATTFQFENDDFARRFASLNEPRLMEVAGNDKNQS
jgi:hypothetical protein